MICSNFILFFTFYSFTILIFNSNLVVMGVPTSTASYSTENVISSSTFRYELMDMEIESCKTVRPIFEPKNLTDVLPDAPIDGTGLRVCRSRKTCCTHQMEDRLRFHVQKDFQNLLHHSSQTIQGLLASTASELQDHVIKLTRQSENKTMQLLSTVYQRMATSAHEPIHKLYDDIINYINSNTSLPYTTSIPPEDSNRLMEYVLEFFSNIFPLVYHQAVHLHWRDFTEEYKVCLKEASNTILPFGDLPKEISSTLSKSLERTRTLVQALTLGSEVLNTTDHIMASSWSNGALDGCFQALLRLYYCPRCQGLSTKIKPCNGYCLNVMRGCLTQQRAQELDLPWNNFLNEIQRLAKQLEQENHQVLHTLTSKLFETFMFAGMNGPTIQEKVKKVCGPSKLVPETTSQQTATQLLPSTGTSVIVPGVTVSSLAQGHSRSSDEHSPLLGVFLRALESTQAKGFFANLAEALCSDESFAETRDTAECWNGQRVGEYTKTLVRPGVDAQKYNPELVWMESDPDPTIRSLSDKLRHIRQVVMGQLSQTQNLVSESYMRDEEEGSGSGQQPVDDDEDDQYEWPHQGSGSGHDAGEDHAHGKITPTGGVNTDVTTGTSGSPGGGGSGTQVNPKTASTVSSIMNNRLQQPTLMIIAVTVYIFNTFYSSFRFNCAGDNELYFLH
ncbi:division abnormally delayed protein [Lycorma delicatula]|uniref:division abnormally delayed protein n=1 Tax=Lycorma delicatula TaxID=130591 RepID=UPI003F5117B3